MTQTVITPDGKVFIRRLYEELLKLTKTDKDKQELAYAAGGVFLVSATNKQDFPPCLDNASCSDCWLKDFCIHKDTPVDIRRELINALEILTDPAIITNSDVIDQVKKYSKIDPNDVATILTLAEHYRVLKENKKNDPTKDS